jgi:hypothetical protein
MSGFLSDNGACCSATAAAGTGVNTFTNLIMTFVVGQTFLSMLCSMKFGVSNILYVDCAGYC